MKSAAVLKEKLTSIDGKGYGAYKEIAGEYDYGWYRLCIDHVQGDPFATPSKLRVVIGQKTAGFPAGLFDTREKKTAVEDYLIRQFRAGIRRFSKGGCGSGSSGRIEIARCGQEVLERTAMRLTPQDVEARFELGLPAHGRSIAGHVLIRILDETLPQILRASMLFHNLPKKEVTAAAELAEDQTAIRTQLKEHGLIAFIGNGAILPRQSGISELPLTAAIPFQSPKSLEVELPVPNRGVIRGMGIPKGITLIVGGGYHGKSTLLKALERGVYNHIAGDGREFVITDETAVKIRAEDGRSIIDTDISLFIDHLPNRKNTKKFCTENASGSTSQAANIIEAIEAGSQVLLIDEDTSATNFMIRDLLMQQLITPDQEPITPFIDRIRPLYEQADISTILVVGSCGSYFQHADHIIQMDAYRPADVTARAKALAKNFGSPEPVPATPLALSFSRIPLKGALPAGNHGIKVKTRGKDILSVNKEEIELRGLEQIVDSEQTAAIGYLLYLAESRFMDGQRTMPEVADAVMAYIAENGLLAAAPGRYCPAFLTMPRKQELMGALNRLRCLKLVRR